MESRSSEQPRKAASETLPNVPDPAGIFCFFSFSPCEQLLLPDGAEERPEKHETPERFRTDAAANNQTSSLEAFHRPAHLAPGWPKPSQQVSSDGAETHLVPTAGQLRPETS